MKCVTPAQMGEIEIKTENDKVISRRDMMYKAGMALAECALEEYNGGKIAVIASKGNNGGDGVVCAGILKERNVSFSLCFICSKDELSPLSSYYMDYFKLDATFSADASDISALLGESSLCVDCILGTGLKGEVSGSVAEVIRAINSADVKVLSADIPSGSNGLTGEGDISVRAHKTVTFGAIKRGLCFYPAREMGGEIVVADIGIPQSYFEEGDEVMDDNIASRIIIPRPKNAHKGTFGKVVLIGGSTGMTGAMCLAANAAARVGAGTVTLGVPKTLNQIFEIKLTEQMTYPLDDNGEGCITYSPKVKDLMARGDVIGVGPGLSRVECVADVVGAVLLGEKPCVLDADALYAVSLFPHMLKNKGCEAVITPHLGEMARLLGVSISEIEKSQREVALEFAREYNVTVVLKSATTVVASPKGEVRIITSGCSSMAKGGSGDVLCGVITSLIGQGYSLFNGASLGAYIVGKAGEVASLRDGYVSALPSDTIKYISNEINRFY